MGGVPVSLADVLSRPDRPGALRGPRRRVGTGTYVQHREGCRALWGADVPLSVRFLLSGCPVCANTREVAEALSVAARAHSHLVGVLESVAEAVTEDRSSVRSLGAIRSQGDPAWGALTRHPGTSLEGELLAWSERVTLDLVGPVFASEPYRSERNGEVTLLVSSWALSHHAPHVVVNRVPHRIFSMEGADLVLLSLSEAEALELEVNAARGVRPMRTLLPLEVLLSSEYEDVWTLALEVLQNAPGSGVLDEVLEVSRRAATR